MLEKNLELLSIFLINYGLELTFAYTTSIVCILIAEVRQGKEGERKREIIHD